MYNDTLLEFKGVKSTAASEKWVTFVNADNNVVEWGGYDISNNQHLLKDGDEIITMQFIALKPQNESALIALLAGAIATDFQIGTSNSPQATELRSPAQSPKSL
jgi:hypothetical protein